MSLILKERYGDLTVEVITASDNPEFNYYVQIHAEHNLDRIPLWKAGFNEEDCDIHEGVETAMADLITSSKSGILPAVHGCWDNYEWVRAVVLRITNTTAFASRFNASHEVGRAVFHVGHRLCYKAKVEIIGKPVDMEIYVRIPHDPLSVLPTYYLKLTAVDQSEEARRNGMTLTSSSRTCCFNYTGSELRFDEHEIIETFKEELIVALGLEG